MKHTKLLAALATAGSLFAATSAHAIVPAVAAGIAALTGAAIGSTAAQQANTPPAVAVVPQPAPLAVAPSDSTVVMGAGPVVQEVVPAPRDGYTWQRGHFEIRNGTSIWVPGHWVR